MISADAITLDRRRQRDGLDFVLVRVARQACTGDAYSHPEAESEAMAPYTLGALSSRAGERWLHCSVRLQLCSRSALSV
eukprot:5353026-Pleurochrysis_carterae.AAC.3